MNLTHMILIIAAIATTETASASLHRSVTGEVVLGKNCEKRLISDFRLVVRQETAIDNTRYQLVPLEENGKYTILLHESYHYDFKVIEAGDITYESLGGVRFDYQQTGQVPVITATCKEPEKKS